jgi:hypothetical protein
MLERQRTVQKTAIAACKFAPYGIGPPHKSSENLDGNSHASAQFVSAAGCVASSLHFACWSIFFVSSLVFWFVQPKTRLATLAVKSDCCSKSIICVKNRPVHNWIVPFHCTGSSSGAFQITKTKQSRHTTTDSLLLPLLQVCNCKTFTDGTRTFNGPFY